MRSKCSCFPGAVLIAAVLAAATIMAFAPALKNGFISVDDGKYVVGNDHIRDGFTREAVAWAFTTFHAANWHPLTWLSHIADYRLFGPAPAGHHLTSLLLHGANVLLLFILLRRLTGARWRSALVAGIFALHPVHVESVAWVAERKDLLCGFLWILALLSYAGYARRPGRGRYLATLLLFALSLLSKPMAVTLPFQLLLLDWWPLGRLRRAPLGGTPGGVAAGRALPLVVEKVPFFALAAVSSFVTLLAQRQGGMVKPLAAYPLAVRLANAVVSYANYLGKIFFPARLALPYPHAGAEISPVPVIASALIVVAASAAALSGARRRPAALVGWLWFLGALAPVIGLVQIADQAMADRYLYLPLLGPLLIAIWGLPPKPANGPKAGKALLAGGALGILLVLGALTNIQTRLWRDDVSLFTHAVRVTSGNALAQYNLGTGLARSGRAAEAVPRFEEALRIRPEFAEAHYNLGRALEELGRLPEAVRHYEEAVRIAPEYLFALHNLGDALTRLGRLPEAVAMLERALQAAPLDADGHYSLGVALTLQGKTLEAAIRFQETLRLAPGHQAARRALDQLRGGKIRRISSR